MAQASTPKVKTKIVFVNLPGAGYYGSYWSLDDTSVPNPVAKVRLMYYRPSTKTWAGYAKRPVAIKRDLLGGLYIPIARVATDRRGYFSFKMEYPGSYRASYAGSAYGNKTSGSRSRQDTVETRTSTVVTTASVDATRTRINIETDYRYNPFVPSAPGVRIVVMTLAGEEPVALYSGWMADPDRPLTGYGHASISFVVASAAVEHRYVGVVSRVGYFGTTDYLCVNDPGDDQWLNTGLTSPGAVVADKISALLETGLNPLER
jgi:hypothetical protein